jgi:pyruvate carboxylase subunit B
MPTKKQTTKTPLKITDTTFRDAHQSLFATRMRTEDMEPIAEDMDNMGFHSVEVWGGATFDVCTRFLGEDPWERLRDLKSLMPKTPFQMLLRGQNLVGYRHYADDLVKAFVEHSADTGIDIFRIFDPLNDERSLETAANAVKKSGKHFQAVICYSVTEEGHLGGPIFNLKYFLEKAVNMRDMGADSLCIKDMAGLLAPYDAFELVSALKNTIDIPLQLHMHYTSGLASMTALKSVEAGLDILDACLAPFALRTSQPAVEPLITTFRGGLRDTGLDLNKLIVLGEYLESIAPKYLHLLHSEKAGIVDPKVLSHQIPGGMASNLISQLKEADAIDRLNEVFEDLPITRKELGYPPLVTPTSQIVGSQAVSNVLFGRYKMISGQIKDYAYGLYGQPPVKMDPSVVKLALKGYPRGETPITGRPADYLEPELEKAKSDTKDIAKDIGDVLIYALYPTTGMKFLRIKHGLDPVPEEMKPKSLAQAQKELRLMANARSGKLAEKPTDKESIASPIISVPTTSRKGRLFNVYVGDEHYQIAVDPVRGINKSSIQRVEPTIAPDTTQLLPEIAAPDSEATSKNNNSTNIAENDIRIEAPMPGIIIRYEVKEGQKIKVGDPLVILEAMKMENTLPSPVDGIVKQLTQSEGAKVAKSDVLAIIAK